MDPRDLALVEHSARVIWRMFPYFAWRYGERGRSFGRSDAGFLATLPELGDEAARKQVAWLAGLLAARGMPSLLLEVQLESLGRAARRFQRPSSTPLRALASDRRRRRLSVLASPVFLECEALCWAAAHGLTERRGAGVLIAAAVADRALGLGDHAEALVRWFADAAPGDRDWALACGTARERALARCRDEESASR